MTFENDVTVKGGGGGGVIKISDKKRLWGKGVTATGNVTKYALATPSPLPCDP